MWPLGGALPRSLEAWMVDLVDTICAGLEVSRVCRPSRLRARLGVRPLILSAENRKPLSGFTEGGFCQIFHDVDEKAAF